MSHNARVKPRLRRDLANTFILSRSSPDCREFRLLVFMFFAIILAAGLLARNSTNAQTTSCTDTAHCAWQLLLKLLQRLLRLRVLGMDPQQI